MNILIYGSCVSRDAFRLIKTNHTITGFVSRNPLGSAFRGRACAWGLNEIDPEGILEDGFPRRMLEMNLRGTVPDYLREKAVASDLLLVDLIDERLPLIDIEGDAVCHCQEFAKVYDPTSAQRISDERRRRMTDSGAAALILLAQECHIPLLINTARWSLDPAGGREMNYSPIANADLDRIFTIFRNRGVPMISYGDHAFHVDPRHTWGAAPYHYLRETYEILLQEIDAWAARRAQKKEDNLECA